MGGRRRKSRAKHRGAGGKPRGIAPPDASTALKQELSGMKLGALFARAAVLGIEEAVLDDAEDRAALIDLIMAAESPSTLGAATGATVSSASGQRQQQGCGHRRAQQGQARPQKPSVLPKELPASQSRHGRPHDLPGSSAEACIDELVRLLKGDGDQEAKLTAPQAANANNEEQSRRTIIPAPVKRTRKQQSEWKRKVQQMQVPGDGIQPALSDAALNPKSSAGALDWAGLNAPLTLQLTDCRIPMFDGTYKLVGSANGRPYWSCSESTFSGGLHLYWSPEQTGMWLLRSVFQEHSPVCSGFCTASKIPAGKCLWSWKEGPAWTPQMLSIKPGAQSRFRSVRLSGTDGKLQPESELVPGRPVDTDELITHLTDGTPPLDTCPARQADTDSPPLEPVQDAPAEVPDQTPLMTPARKLKPIYPMPEGIDDID